MRRTLSFTFIIAMIMAVAASTAFGYFETMPDDRINASVTINGQSANQSTALAALFPAKRVNGHAAFFIQRQVGNDEVISEIIAGEIQGGFDIKKIEFRGVIEVERDIHRGIGFSRQISYFASPPELTIGDITFDSGFGNYTQNVQVLETLGKKPDQTSFGWLAFLDARWKAVNATLTVEPEWDFKALQAELAAGVTKAVSKEVSIGVMTKILFDSEPIKGEKIHSQYTIFANWTP